MAVERRKPGLVCTFYSYKGGVGRSMALANVAALLARLGQKVLVVDWDLEAPGLEQYFGQSYRVQRKSTPGLIDLIESFSAENDLDWRDCRLNATIPKGEAVDIIHAGLDNAAYSDRLRSLNWDALFDGGFGRRLEDMRSAWKREYDYIFVDSRTGITDIGGICSILLPDYLVSMFTTSEQSIMGVRDTMMRARAAQKDLPLDRQRLIIIPIAARDESNTEYKRAAEWRKRFAQELSEFYDDWIHKDETAESVLDYLKIPYVAYWSFGEQLPVLSEDASNPKTLAYSYALIARLIHSRLDWSEVREGKETTELQAQREAEVQVRLADAAKARTEALSQQQAESERRLEVRKAALLERFRSLRTSVELKQRQSDRLAAIGLAIIVLGGFGLAVGFYLIPASPALPFLSIFPFSGAGLFGFAFPKSRRQRVIFEELQREYSAYTVAHGRYADLGNEAALRLFGDSIEVIAQDSSSRGAAAWAPGPTSSSSAAPSVETSGMPLPPPPGLPPSPSQATSASRVSQPPVAVDLTSIDALITYAREGIARDWAMEFVPLFARWLSEMLGREAKIIDASTLALGEDSLRSFQTAASNARTAVLIVSGRTQEIADSAEFTILMDRFPSSGLFPVVIGGATRLRESPIARFQWMDFSDLVYLGEGFTKSERYLEFQDRVRALAKQVADEIQRQPTLKPASA